MTVTEVTSATKIVWRRSNTNEEEIKFRAIIVLWSQTRKILKGRE
jgi:hypothetical protein